MTSDASMRRRLQLDVQALDLVATIRAALEGLLPAIQAKQLRLQIRLDEQIGMITGDPVRLQQ